MRMYLLLAFFLVGCDSDNAEGVKFLPVNPKELLYHKGDVLAFEADSSTTGAAIVTNCFREADDSAHVWYDFVCLDYAAKQIPTLDQLRGSRLFGRKIESSLDAAGYIVGLDIESVRNDCLVGNAAKFHLIGRLPLDTAAIKMGSQGAASSYKRFVDSFIDGQKRRLLPPDYYTEQLKLDTFRPEEYFPVQNYLLKQL